MSRLEATVERLEAEATKRWGERWTIQVLLVGADAAVERDGLLESGVGNGGASPGRRRRGRR